MAKVKKLRQEVTASSPFVHENGEGEQLLKLMRTLNILWSGTGREINVYIFMYIFFQTDLFPSLCISFSLSSEIALNHSYRISFSGPYTAGLF